jgi:hypothetical protein
LNSTNPSHLRHQVNQAVGDAHQIDNTQAFVHPDETAIALHASQSRQHVGIMFTCHVVSALAVCIFLNLNNATVIAGGIVLLIHFITSIFQWGSKAASISTRVFEAHKLDWRNHFWRIEASKDLSERQVVPLETITITTAGIPLTDYVEKTGMLPTLASQEDSNVPQASWQYLCNSGSHTTLYSSTAEGKASEESTHQDVDQDFVGPERQDTGTRFGDSTAPQSIGITRRGTAGPSGDVSTHP